MEWRTREEIDKITARPGEKLVDMLPRMEQAALQVLLVIDSERHLLGIITDGDIRRVLLHGEALEIPLLKVMNPEPKTFKTGTSIDIIKKLMLDKNIRHVPLLDEHGRLTDLVLWLDLFGKTRTSRTEQVVIMAGGKGTRLAPFTKILPKPMIPLGEKPMVEIVMDRFYSQGFSDFILSVGYKAEIIKLYFSESDTRPYQVNFVQEAEPLGTAGALYLLKSEIKNTFIVTNCDVVVEADFEDILDFHREKGHALTVVGSLKKFTIPYGVLRTEDGVLNGVEEKPDFHFLVNTGTYVLEPELFSLFPEQRFLHMTEVIDLAREQDLKVGMYPYHGRWFDLGQWEEYRQTLKAFEM
jgi:dTDP-glucose pyrophosphorylase/CBS domain-containing protein